MLQAVYCKSVRAGLDHDDLGSGLQSHDDAGGKLGAPSPHRVLVEETSSGVRKAREALFRPLAGTVKLGSAMAAEIHQFLCLKDNFGVLLHDPRSGATAAVDAPEASPILAALERTRWRLTDVLITHHHYDHVQGILGLLACFPQARVFGPRREADKIRGLTHPVDEGDRLSIGALEARVIEVPGHTSGHVAYWLEDEKLLFAGDTLFAMGCGRGFEEPAHVLYRSLQRLARLPRDTKVYCGHEYTLANARFALTVDGGNALLKERFAEVTRQRENGEFTLPTTIERELATNPFLRAEEPAIKAAIGMTGAEPAAVFAELRERKNRM